VLRVDGNYLYTFGWQIHALNDLKWNSDRWGKATTAHQAALALSIAESAIDPVANGRTVFGFRTCLQSAQSFLTAIKELKDKLMEEENGDRDLEWGEAFAITSELRRFEAIMGAELSLSPLYVVSPKAGYDTAVLISSGAQCFPQELPAKAPDAVADVQEGTKCIAFELFTAAAFHFHRANEAVLHRYWDAVTKGALRPHTRNIGDYLAEMRKKKVGDPKVIAALTELKDLHRNPLIHEESIKDLEEAIAVMHGVNNAMVYMFKQIPAVAPVPVQQAGAAPTP
jgi:hypothetical protein